jgi:hypothetical protein
MKSISDQNNFYRHKKIIVKNKKVHLSKDIYLDVTIGFTKKF